MAATNRNLQERIDEGEFRADLYYRLRVVEIAMPPLRERRNDIPALSEYFVSRCCRQLNLGEIAISDDAIDLLMRHSWRGNVRELENVIKNCLVRLNGNVIRSEDLDLAPDNGGGAPAVPSGVTQPLCDESVFDAVYEEIARRQPLPPGMDAFDVVERRLVVRALEHCRGNQSQAARFLGITRNTLRKRIQKYGLTIARSVSAEEV
jgi:DNA-binding NtrC family response regulator